MNKVEVRTWTKAGKDRLELKCRALKKAAHGKADSLKDLRCGQNAGNSNDRIDFDATAADKQLTERQLEDAERLLGTVRVAPSPTQFQTGQVGLQFRVRYLDATASRARGQEEDLILGGPDEFDLESIVRTIACNTALGRALVGSMAGDERTIRTEPNRLHPRGESYEIEILSMQIPNTSQPSAAAA